jgi:cysteine desulfurase
MMPYFSEFYGNPSSFHSKGFDAIRAMNEAREKVSALINADTTEIIFTSTATEANNLGIGGAARRYKKKGNRIVISAIEHISVLNTVKELSREGFEIKFLPVNPQGIIDLGELEKLIDDETILVSVMTANNEIGTIQPIESVSEITHEHGALLHSDATAAAGQIPINIIDSKIDLITLSSNDLYGPKGVGALFIRKGIRVKPQILGGGQESGTRSGSEYIPGIVGMGKAAELVLMEMQSEGKRLTTLRDELIGGILEEIPESFLNGHPKNRLPNNANIRFNYVEGEALILSLDQVGIQVSSGSACTAKTLEPSHVLMALGLKHEEAHGSLVFTLGKSNNEEDVEYVMQQIPNVVGRLRAMSPLTPKEMR